MLNKKILKSILNVKHTAIDDMKILPDGTIAIKAHPTKGEQCRCVIAAENLSAMTMAVVAPVLGGFATGIPTRSIL